ncbi:MAG: aminoacyl-histidine dipeptidase [Clostridia bacterium]|nr:aminoacyl-histidine dipeptidase [Clostridia bacterium]
MSKFDTIKIQRVFQIFEELCAVPRGSGNMEGVAQFCMDFANENQLKAVRDKANNIVIYKPATNCVSNEPIILQGHLDMVCQKTADSNIDFLKDGIDIFVDGDFVKARGTTLGADNGVAVAMILAILERNDISHPPIEALFTTDEEIGMIGATALDCSLLKGKKMINLDAEEDDTVTVSCAGGSDFKAVIPITREAKKGTAVTVTIKGLKGGHSGVEINSGRVNSNILAGRFLNCVKDKVDFDIISINGGDKSNAIPNTTVIELCTADADGFIKCANDCFEVIKKEIARREPAFVSEITVKSKGEYAVFSQQLKNSAMYTLLCVPNGVMDMSVEIPGLVETSLNLGVLATDDDGILMQFALRSNKQSALIFLEQKMKGLFSNIPCRIYTSGHYPPWEFKENSQLQKTYIGVYTDHFGIAPKVEAIHAGLECGVFSAKIDGLDCIAIGPSLYDVHTVNEKLSISSTEQIFSILLKTLEKIC